MKKRELTRNTVKLVIVSICMAIALLISAFYTVIVIKTILNDDKITIDPEYALYVANGELVTKKYDIESGNTLSFFSSFEKDQRTLFSGAVPSLKIVNDTESYVEVTSNTEVHEALEISSCDGVITIKCKDDLYNRVHENDREYDYDYGLYVDCTKLEFVVHSPVSSFRTYTNLELDFDVAKSDKVYIHFSFDGVNGTIHNIDTENLTLYCSGTSNLKLEGAVRDTAEITIYHNTHIDARQLSASSYDTYVSRGIGGFSYIACEKWYQIKCDLIGGPTNVIEFLIFLPTICWIYYEVKLIKKRKQLLSQKNEEAQI